MDIEVSMQRQEGEGEADYQKQDETSTTSELTGEVFMLGNHPSFSYIFSLFWFGLFLPLLRLGIKIDWERNDWRSDLNPRPCVGLCGSEGVVVCSSLARSNDSVDSWTDGIASGDVTSEGPKRRRSPNKDEVAPKRIRKELTFPTHYILPPYNSSHPVGESGARAGLASDIS